MKIFSYQGRRIRVREEKPVTGVNANYHHVAGEDLLAKEESRFKEYRRRWRERPETFYKGEFPLFIDIEVTSACNLKCPFCATTFRKDIIKNGFIEYRLIKKIIDEGADNNLYGVKFNIRGEPLLHPEIDRFVYYAKRKGLIDVYFNTNAMLLTKDISARLIKAGLDRISISAEGYTKQEYEKDRVGANFETLLANIKGLLSLRKQLGVKYPKIRVQTVMLPELEYRFEEYKRFWIRYADEIGFLDYKHMKAKSRGVIYPWACPQLWQRMAILWDGTILPCNHDDDALLALGNVRQARVKDAWHSAKMGAIRDAHRKGNAHGVDACDGCYLRNSEILKLMREKEKV